MENILMITGEIKLKYQLKIISLIIHTRTLTKKIAALFNVFA